jgi:hypothetical protein
MVMPKNKSKAEAQAAGLLYYNTGKPCKHGHLADRFTNGGHCAECKLLANQRWNAANPEAVATRREAFRTSGYSKVYYAERKEAISATRRAHQAQEHIKVARQERYAGYPPEKIAEWGKRWRDANKHHGAAKQARRRATMLRATPLWADDQALKDFYVTADALGMWTGEWHHVDHIVPLNSQLVCGLHTPANLQVLPGADNIAKSNRFWPNMP